MVDVDVAGVLVGRREQVPPLGVERSGVLLRHAVVEIVLHAPLARRGLEVEGHVAVVHPAVELVFLPAAQQARPRRHALGKDPDGRQIADLVRPVVLHVQRAQVAERPGLGEPLGRGFQPQRIGKAANDGPVAVLRRPARMEQQQHLVGLVLAAAERKIGRISAGKQPDLDRAVLVGRQRLRVVLPEVCNGDGQPLGRIGHVEPAQRPLACPCFHAAEEGPEAWERHVTVGPRMELGVLVAVPMLAATGVLVDLGLRVQRGHDGRALEIPADADPAWPA